MSKMDNVTALLEQRFQKQIRAHQVIEPGPGDYADFPDALQPKLRLVLEVQGIAKLYAHQADAFDSISRGENTVSHSSQDTIRLRHCPLGLK